MEKNFELHFFQSLNSQEAKILNRVSTYFRSPKMNLEDKLTHARLIALHDMELGYFSSDEEHQLLQTYAQTLDQLLAKLHHQSTSYSYDPGVRYSII